jgi:LmbE family N-acetylglucosaminyl deacetylase
MKKTGASSYYLLCIAHPDDETIFFGGLIQRKRDRPWTVVCMTDANADGQGKKRKRQFQRACQMLGVQDPQWWGYNDIFEKRLPVEEIVSRLQNLPKPHSIFTHGIIGEYGHPHHQDVSFSVHEAFKNHPRLYSCSYNATPDLGFQLKPDEFIKKATILTEVYGSETSRFLNLLPSTAFEGFLKLDEKEVRALYDYFARDKSLRTKDLKAYAWLAKFLKSRRHQPRPF